MDILHLHAVVACRPVVRAHRRPDFPAPPAGDPDSSSSSFWTAQGYITAYLRCRAGRPAYTRSRRILWHRACHTGVQYSQARSYTGRSRAHTSYLHTKMTFKIGPLRKKYNKKGHLQILCHLGPVYLVSYYLIYRCDATENRYTLTGHRITRATCTQRRHLKTAP